MARILIALAMLCAMIAPTFAQTQLPEDADRYTLLVVTASPPTADDARLLQSLEAEPAKGIADRCHRINFTPLSELYQQRYAATLPPTTLPIVALVRGDGGVVYKSTGPAIPNTPKALADELTRYAQADRNASKMSGTAPAPPPGPPEARPWLSLGGRRILPDGLGRVIPDTVTVEHTVDASNVWPAVIAVGLALAALILFGMVGAAVIGLLLYFRR